MPYMNTQTGQLNLSLWDVRLAHPNLSLPDKIPAIGDFVYYEDSYQPPHDPLTQSYREIPPVDGKQTFEVYDLSPEEVEEIRKSRVPTVITMRQAQLALLEIEKLDDIEAVIATLPRAAQIEWTTASVVERTHPLVNSVGMTERELDDLFVLAASK